MIKNRNKKLRIRSRNKKLRIRRSKSKTLRNRKLRNRRSKSKSRNKRRFGNSLEVELPKLYPRLLHMNTELNTLESNNDYYCYDKKHPRNAYLCGLSKQTADKSIIDYSNSLKKILKDMDL